jgi:hypothetical protein
MVDFRDYDEIEQRKRRADERASRGMKDTTLETHRLEQDHATDEVLPSRAGFSHVLANVKQTLQKILGRE